jgi:hypothetical protein
LFVLSLHLCSILPVLSPHLPASLPASIRPTWLLTFAFGLARLAAPLPLPSPLFLPDPNPSSVCPTPCTFVELWFSEPLTIIVTMGGFYMQYLQSLCRRRGWTDPMYECYRGHSGYTCLVLVNGREYQTDLAYESDVLAQENAAMRAFMVCRNFSVNGGMLARNGIVQGLPATDGSSHRRKGRVSPSSRSRRSGDHSSSSSTTSD